MTQTVPDISPLMPMHQDPLLVYIEWTTCGTHVKGYEIFNNITFESVYLKLLNTYIGIRERSKCPCEKGETKYFNNNFGESAWKIPNTWRIYYLRKTCLNAVEMAMTQNSETNWNSYLNTVFCRIYDRGLLYWQKLAIPASGLGHG